MIDKILVQVFRHRTAINSVTIYKIYIIYVGNDLYSSNKEITPTFATFVEELINFFSHRIFKNHAFIG